MPTNFDPARYVETMKHYDQTFGNQATSNQAPAPQTLNLAGTDARTALDSYAKSLLAQHDSAWGYPAGTTQTLRPETKLPDGTSLYEKYQAQKQAVDNVQTVDDKIKRMEWEAQVKAAEKAANADADLKTELHRERIYQVAPNTISFDPGNYESTRQAAIRAAHVLGVNVPDDWQEWPALISRANAELYRRAQEQQDRQAAEAYSEYTAEQQREVITEQTKQANLNRLAELSPEALNRLIALAGGQ